MGFEDWQRQNEAAGLTGFEAWQKETAVAEAAPTDKFEAWRQNNVAQNLAPETEEDKGFSALISEFGKGLVSMSLRAGRAFIGTGETLVKAHPVLKKLYSTEIPQYDIRTGEWERKTGFERIEEAKEEIALTEDKFPMTHRGAAAWAGRIIGEAVPFMGAALAAGYAIGPVAGPVMTGFTIEGDIAYEDAIEGGASEATAQFERFVVGSINGYLEALQIGKIMKFHTTGRHTLKNMVRLIRSKAYKTMAKEGLGLTGDILKLMTQEALQEFLQEGVSITVPALTRGDVPRTPEGQVDFLAIGSRLGQAALGGGLVGGVFAGGGAVFGTIPYAARPTDIEIDSSLTRIRESKLNPGEKARLSKQLELLREEPRKEKKPYTETIEEAKDFYRDKLINPELANKAPVFETYAGFVAAIPVGKSRKSGTFDAAFKNSQEAEAIYDQLKGKRGFPNLRIVEFEGAYNIEWGEEAILPMAAEEQGKLYGYTEKAISEFLGLSAAIDLDISVEKLGRAIDEIEEVRPIEEEEISAERGKRFAQFADILQGEPNPIIAQRVARAALAGRLKIQITPFIEDTFAESDAMPLYDAIRNATLLEGEKISAFDGLNRLIFEGNIPARHEVSAMQAVFGKDIAASLIKKRKQLGADRWQTTLDVINVPRAVLASYDMSAPLRQGLLMLPLVPKQWLKSVGRAYRAFVSQPYTDFIDTQLRTHPYFDKLQRSGLFLSRVGSLTAGEEYWRGQMGEKIPYIGAGIRASERAYTTFLNSVRANAFYKICEQWEGTGKSAQDYKNLAKFLNHATGRGDWKWVEKHLDIFNVAFFAPRLLMGRIQVLTDLFGSTSPVRKIIAADLLEGVGVGMLILGLVSMMKGVSVEKNPLSTDFGKIRYGKTRIDFWGGYQQIARYTAQLLVGMRKTTETKRLVKVPRGDVVWRFIQSKLSPPAGFVLDMARGETFLGRKLRFEPAIIGRETFERFVPLFVQDVIDAARFQGMSGLAMVAPTALHGVGAMTYPITAMGEEIKTKNALSQRYFGQQWDELGPTFQQAIENANPQINLMREKSRMERENWSFMERIGEQEAAAARKIHKGLPRFVQDELDRYIVRITGLSRIISGDWSLNDKRYSQYQERVAFVLNKALPRIILNTNYRNLSFENKRLVLQNIIDLAKRAAREEMAREANMNDLVRNDELIQKRLYRRKAE